MGKYSIPMDSILLPLFYLTPYGAGASDADVDNVNVDDDYHYHYGDDHSS